MTTPATHPIPTEDRPQLTLFIPGVPSNANHRGQWARHRANSERQKFRRRAAQIAEIDGDGWTPLPFTVITARHVSPVKRRRDPLGLAERLKGIVDGLVDAGLLPDDDEDHIEVHLLHSARGTQAGIELTLSAPKET